MLPHHENTAETISRLTREIEELRGRVVMLEQTGLSAARLFHPAVGLVCGLATALVMALACLYLFEGQQLAHFLSYNVPIAVPFVGFLFDRALVYLGRPGKHAASFSLDGILVALALWRAVFPLPVISGHALFLTYALITTRSAWAKIPAVVVLAEVAYFKIFLWHDVTLLGGALVGMAAALAWRTLERSASRAA